MEEDNTHDESKWKLEVNQPFQGHKQKFAEILKQSRPAFIRQLLKTPQINTLPPYNYHIPFPNQSIFKYKQYDINYYSIENTPHPKAILIILHGMNNNASPFGYLAHRVAEKNKQINIYAFDQMNFGKSKGSLRGLIVSLDDTVAQLETFIEHILGELQGKPKVFLCGMSYGGSVAFKATINNPQKYAGVIFLAAALRDNSEMMYYGKKIVNLIGWLMPRLSINKQIPFLNSKYNITEQLRADPLVFTDCIMPGTIRSVTNAMSQISKLYSKFTSPFLCIASGVEKMLDPFAALDFYEESPAKDKKVVYAQTMWHAVMYEEEIVGVSWHCAEWLRERV